jgi:hypothetical protein
MKRTFAAFCLLFVLSLATFGGEVETPGRQDPAPSPTPCDTCQTSGAITTTETGESDAAVPDLFWIIASLVWP